MADNEEKERCNANNDKAVLDKEVQTEDSKEVKEKETQTAVEGTCICKEECTTYRVHYDTDKVICIMKRAKCSELNKRNMKKKLNRKWNFQNYLKISGKVLEAADWVNLKKKN